MSDEPLLRVLRVIEYVGERRWIQLQLKNSIHGEKTLPATDMHGGGTIKAATLGLFPDEVINTLFDLQMQFNDGTSGQSSTDPDSSVRLSDDFGDSVVSGPEVGDAGYKVDP